jgi:hypothetical protein
VNRQDAAGPWGTWSICPLITVNSRRYQLFRLGLKQATERG